VSDQQHPADTERSEPTLIDLVQELRHAVGLFDGAMTITPKQAWEEAIAEIKRLRHSTGRGDA
jgi:hypothetical protein